MKAYSEDLRLRVLTALDGVLSRAEAVQTFQVSVSSIDRRRTQRSALGYLRPRRSPGRPRKIAHSGETSLRAQLSASPNATLPEHIRTWADQQGISLSR